MEGSAARRVVCVEKPVTDDLATVIEALRKSGFPFQTRVAWEIRAQARHGWSVITSEHAWQDRAGDDQFIDLVARWGDYMLLIECKKGQERAMTFLRPLGYSMTGMVDTFACFMVEIDDVRLKRWRSSHRGDIRINPASHVSELCVYSTDKSGRAQRLLERDARLLALAADRFAEVGPRDHFASRTLLVPVIVTTAPLYTLEYRPDEISPVSASFLLMRAFHERLPALGPAGALREAQSAATREFPHPFAWAAFGLTGAPR